MKEDEFLALTDRLDNGATVLQGGGALLQAIARRYYLVYAYAAQAAEKHGVGFRRGTLANEDRRMSHQVLPDVVLALYAARNSGPVLGGGPGIIRTSRLDDRTAYRYVDLLQKDRKFADYGGVSVREPYDVVTAEERLGWANHLVEDLRSLI
ncbi:MAG TPA: hypothetical protein VGU66_04405 [Candidatus Elarobacter sp.]|nr:hypothetical protein [Candidatus Elarobacter sp.]